MIIGLLVLALAIILSISISQGISHLGQLSDKNVCNTPGCISAAHSLIQNMDASGNFRIYTKKPYKVA